MSSEGPSALGAHLAEMDALLREIQVELAPDREPAPALGSEPEPDPAPVPEPKLEPDSVPDATTPARDASARDASARDAPATTPDPQVPVLTEVSTSLLASMRELLSGYERIVVGRPPPRPARRATHRPAASPDVTLSAAPFANLEALHAFEQAVSKLPGVREVAVQGYEGTDRAIIAVRLDQPNP